MFVEIEQWDKALMMLMRKLNKEHSWEEVLLAISFNLHWKPHFEKDVVGKCLRRLISEVLEAMKLQIWSLGGSFSSK